MRVPFPSESVGSTGRGMRGDKGVSSRDKGKCRLSPKAYLDLLGDLHRGLALLRTARTGNFREYATDADEPHNLI